MRPARWRAYYTDDRRFDSADTEWADLPDDGVLAVKLWLESGTQAIYGYDWYFRVPQTGLYGGNDDDPDEIRRRYPGAVLKRGKWIPSNEWRQVKRRAQRE